MSAALERRLGRLEALARPTRLPPVIHQRPGETVEAAIGRTVDDWFAQNPNGRIPAGWGCLVVPEPAASLQEWSAVVRATPPASPKG